MCISEYGNSADFKLTLLVPMMVSESDSCNPMICV